MKKLLILLFSLLISFKSYGGLFDKTVCVETDSQLRDGVIYLPNKTKPFSGKNLCKYENGFLESQGSYKNGNLVSETKYSYNENGQMKSVEFVANNKLNGKVTKWNADGKIVSVSTYKNGKCISGDCPD